MPNLKTSHPKLRTIRWGILGLGKIAKEFARDLAVVPSAELLAVASRSEERAQAFATEFGVATAYGSYEALATDERIDAIYIATPHTSHCETTLLCLQHQKAVLCEKPLAMNLQQVEEMIASAQEHDTLLMEALWTRFLPSFQYVHELISQEKYGKVLRLEADFGFQVPFDPHSRLFNKELGGGSLLDIGIYPVFLALSCFGYPKHIEAKAIFGETGVDEACDLVFHHKNQTEAHLHCTFREHTPTQAVFTCEHATITMHTQFYQISKVTVATTTKTRTLSFDAKGKGYYLEAHHFQELLRNDQKESPLLSFAFSKELMRLLDDIRQRIGLVY